MFSIFWYDITQERSSPYKGFFGVFAEKTGENRQFTANSIFFRNHIRCCICPYCKFTKRQCLVVAHNIITDVFVVNPEKETNFENCVADVNIPVGEVFTSPQLAGTEGVLHVSRVFLNELEYRDLSLRHAIFKIRLLLRF